MQQEGWAAVLKYMGDGSVQEMKVTSASKGGVLGMLAGIEGFVPYSQLYKVRDSTAAQDFKYYQSLLASPQDLKMKVKVIAVSSPSADCLSTFSLLPHCLATIHRCIWSKVLEHFQDEMFPYRLLHARVMCHCLPRCVQQCI